MSFSTCITCNKMVSGYQKYCPTCVTKYGVLQDEDWDMKQHSQLSTQQVRDEVRRDQALKSDADSLYECGPEPIDRHRSRLMTQSVKAMKNLLKRRKRGLP